ncbi:hypothetical protein ABZV80_42015 [Streptomyces sp. NPDC005132]|uniref:hypothetical protein n=1 Tax=Streptomyces sp. NPDC005132 TaxID=3154294 RepID=UPI0033BD9F7B
MLSQVRRRSHRLVGERVRGAGLAEQQVLGGGFRDTAELRGRRGRATDPGWKARRKLLRNLLLYGLGGLVPPFIGIKLIDLLISTAPRLG